MAVRVFQTTRKDIVRVDQMARVSVFDEGVGIFDDRNRMIGWIETADAEEQALVSDILLEIMDNPRRAKKPDFSFIGALAGAATSTSTSVVTSARTAVMPQRTNTGSSSGSNNSSNTSSS